MWLCVIRAEPPPPRRRSARRPSLLQIPGGLVWRRSRLPRLQSETRRVLCASSAAIERRGRDDEIDSPTAASCQSILAQRPQLLRSQKRHDGEGDARHQRAALRSRFASNRAGAEKPRNDPQAVAHRRGFATPRCDPPRNISARNQRGDETGTSSTAIVDSVVARGAAAASRTGPGRSAAPPLRSHITIDRGRCRRARETTTSRNSGPHTPAITNSRIVHPRLIRATNTPTRRPCTTRWIAGPLVDPLLFRARARIAAGALHRA